MKISQFPRGLLALLNVQSGGRAPNDLSEIIAPSVDVGKFFEAQLMVQQSATDATPSAGNNPVITIPANEIWIVYQCSAFLDLGAGGTGLVAATVVLNSSNSNLLGELVTGVDAATVWSQARNLPITFPAGTQFGAYCNLLANANSCGVNLLYTPLRAGG